LVKDRFTFYVGPGNNRNLIRALMKKRAWFVEVDSVEEANFVWSQLKVKEMLEKEEKMGGGLVEEPDSWGFRKKD
jgi:hypothetical protein